MRGPWFSLLFLVVGTNGLQLPFKIPFFASQQQVLEAPQVPRIAIVGAGAGGSSAAFWIAKAKERFGLNVEVDVYERNSFVGGRSTVVYPYNDSDTFAPVEIGASIFVAANKNLWRASEEFNLTRRDFSKEKEDYEVGVWDGENILLTVGNSWWDTAKVLWRYGIWSPRQTQSLVDSMIKKYLTLYSSETPRWDDISDLAEALEFSDMTQKTMLDYLTEHGVSQQYAQELVEAATRVNYGQNVDQIHALEGACSMAANQATGIKGGNFQIFEKFLEYSKATVYMNTRVESILPLAESSKYWTVKTSTQSKTYSSVILAAPFHQTAIEVPTSIASSIPKQPYVRLHVTLLSTTSPTANASPEFNSVSYHGLIRDGEWVVKIFSEEEVSDEYLTKLFGEGKVGWAHKTAFDAYPVLPPTSTFPPVKLDHGFYYVNSFEP
ncbi:Prenylcysteine lyase-domain-containing protein [Flagelloscypha sp. PMI_526]|nr:Prenylcysteine lyase-domain-containing protein [Flagelloscypha sp. PMI_526]